MGQGWGPLWLETVQGGAPLPLRTFCDPGIPTWQYPWRDDGGWEFGGGLGRSCLPACVASPGQTPPGAIQLTGLLAEPSLSEGVAHRLPRLVLKPVEPRTASLNPDHWVTFG